MVSAEDVGRSLRGAAGLLNRQQEAVGAFDTSLQGFVRSFSAVALTAPAFVVALALQRRTLGLDVTRHALFDDAGLVLLVGAGHLASFVALPVAMAVLARRLALGARFVPFVVATNWVGVFGSYLLAVPGALYLAGWETEALTRLFTVGFAAIVLHAQWFAAKVTLRSGTLLAAAVTGLGLLLDLGIDALVDHLAS